MSATVSMLSVGVGKVGDEEDPPTKVRRTKGGSRNTLPLRIVPEGGKVSEYLSHVSIKQPWHVLHEDVARS